MVLRGPAAPQVNQAALVFLDLWDLLDVLVQKEPAPQESKETLDVLDLKDPKVLNELEILITFPWKRRSDLRRRCKRLSNVCLVRSNKPLIIFI